MLTSAADFARTQLELGRIRSKRTELTGKLRLDHNDTAALHRVAALDRYERYLLTKRRRASMSFEASISNGKAWRPGCRGGRVGLLPERTQFD
jgi:hypothetical protein